MNIFFLLFSGSVGAMVGSFLNVVIYRYGAKSIHKGRSICLSCSEKIRIRDLVPIFSYVFLGGKCATCKTKISLQYLFVEMVMTVMGILVYLTLPQHVTILQTIVYIIYHIVLIALLVAIAVYDYKHKIIPDEFSFTFATLALVGLFFTPWGAFTFPAFSELLVGPVLAAIPAGLFYFSKGKWMGLGDAKLFLGVGFMLGLLGYSAFVLAFWIGAIVSVVTMRIPKSGLTMQTQIPFAPFIVVATLLVFFTKVDVLGFSRLL